MDVNEQQQQEYRKWAASDPLTVIAAAEQVTHDLSPSERQKFAPLIESVRRFEGLQRALQGTNFVGIPSQT